MKSDKRNIPVAVADLFVIALVLLLELFQVRDVAKAEGLGIFFEMLWGGKRETYLMILYFIDLAIMLLLAIIPLMVLKKMSLKNMARLLLLIFALVPLVDYSNLVHLLDNGVFGIPSAPILIFGIYKTVISVLGPGCIILYFVAENNGKLWNKKAPIAVSAIVFLLIALSIVMYPLSGVFAIITYSILVISVFVVNDACSLINKNYDKYCRIIFAITFLVGLYVRFEKTSHY